MSIGYLVLVGAKSQVFVRDRECFTHRDCESLCCMEPLPSKRIGQQKESMKGSKNEQLDKAKADLYEISTDGTRYC